MGLVGFTGVQAVAADAPGWLSGLGFPPLSIALGDARLPPGSCQPLCRRLGLRREVPGCFLPKSKKFWDFLGAFPDTGTFTKPARP